MVRQRGAKQEKVSAADAGVSMKVEEKKTTLNFKYRTNPLDEAILTEPV